MGNCCCGERDAAQAAWEQDPALSEQLRRLEGELAELLHRQAAGGEARALALLGRQAETRDTGVGASPVVQSRDSRDSPRRSDDVAPTVSALSAGPSDLGGGDFAAGGPPVFLGIAKGGVKFVEEGPLVHEVPTGGPDFGQHDEVGRGRRGMSALRDLTASEVFDLWDSNHDGELTREEMLDGLVALFGAAEREDRPGEVAAAWPRTRQETETWIEAMQERLRLRTGSEPAAAAQAAQAAQPSLGRRQSEALIALAREESGLQQAAAMAHDASTPTSEGAVPSFFAARAWDPYARAAALAVSRGASGSA